MQGIMPPRQSKPDRKPAPVGKRLYAEDCAAGDLVQWAIPPKVRTGTEWEDAPSSTGEVTMFVGRAPYTAFVRFTIDGRRTDPIEVKRGQRLTVTRAR